MIGPPSSTRATVCVLVVALARVMASAQDVPRQPPPLEASQLLPPAPAGPVGAREVRARLTLLRPPVPSSTTPGEPAVAPPTSVDVLSVRAIDGPAPIDLKPELSPFHLLLVSVDAAGARVTWSLVLDPRRVRAEFPGADGVREGTELLREVTELQFVIPDDPRITAVHVYEPSWTGSSYVLRPLGICEVAAR
jgi:hypothetical protein